MTPFKVWFYIVLEKLSRLLMESFLFNFLDYFKKLNTGKAVWKHFTIRTKYFYGYKGLEGTRLWRQPSSIPSPSSRIPSALYIGLYYLYLGLNLPPVFIFNDFPIIILHVVVPSLILTTLRFSSGHELLKSLPYNSFSSSLCFCLLLFQILLTL